MTKQEIIREGMRDIVVNGMVSQHKKSSDIVDEILTFQASMDVAIKVEGELPENTVRNGKGWKCAHAVFVGQHYETLVECPLFKAGYTAVESLVNNEL